MKFLTFFLAILTALCAYFWITDAPGSGLVYPTLGFPVLWVLILLFVRWRTGKWFSDSSGGK